jgi:hypothetical protein
MNTEHLKHLYMELTPRGKNEEIQTDTIVGHRTCSFNAISCMGTGRN